MTDYKPLRVRLVDEDGESFRDRLMAVLEMEDLGQVTITLRGGKQIILGGRQEKRSWQSGRCTRWQGLHRGEHRARRRGPHLRDGAVLRDLQRRVLLVVSRL